MKYTVHQNLNDNNNCDEKFLKGDNRAFLRQVTALGDQSRVSHQHIQRFR